VINKHKVFISYHHQNDEKYKNELLDLNEIYDLFDDYSVRDGEINDNLSAEQIRRKIRDDFIRKAKVLILLCGLETKKRKHIDWEINAAMFNTDQNSRLGIVIINLPTAMANAQRASNNEEKKIISDDNNWISLKTRAEQEQYHPYMPSRIIDNFVKGIEIPVINWNRIKQDPTRLKKLVDNAFKRRKLISYDHSAPLRKNNS
jgi:hypothetical protein